MVGGEAGSVFVVDTAVRSGLDVASVVVLITASSVCDVDDKVIGGLIYWVFDGI